MNHPVCTIHNTKSEKVLNGRKITIFCPECAQKNMDKILKEERNKESSEKLAKLAQERKKSISEIWKGIFISIYLIILSFVLAAFYPYTEGSYVERVAYIYNTYIFHPVVLSLIAFFFFFGLYYIVQATKRIRLLHKKKIQIVESTEKVSQILSEFLSPKRVELLKNFVKGLWERFERSYSMKEESEMAQMSYRELQGFTIKSLKKLGYKNIKYNNHYDSDEFGIHYLAENNQGKHAISILKDEIIITMDDINRIAIGKAYFDCNECILVTASKLTEDAKKLADKLYINVWNQEKMNGLLKRNLAEQWLKFLESYFDYSDADLEKYTNAELKRIQRTY